MQIDGPFPIAITLPVTEHQMAPTAEACPLVAGKVSEKVSFNDVALNDVALTELQPLQLYARAADRIEAATRIATGQQIDIQV